MRYFYDVDVVLKDKFVIYDAIHIAYVKVKRALFTISGDFFIVIVINMLYVVSMVQNVQSHTNKSNLSLTIKRYFILF